MARGGAFHTGDTPQGREKIFMRNLRGKFASALPAHRVHPQAEQESNFMTFFCWAGKIWRWEWFI